MVNRVIQHNDFVGDINVVDVVARQRRRIGDVADIKADFDNGFRAANGVKHFATIRSYLSTLRKQSADIFKSLLMTFQGSPPMPMLE